MEFFKRRTERDKWDIHFCCIVVVHDMSIVASLEPNSFSQYIFVP